MSVDAEFGYTEDLLEDPAEERVLGAALLSRTQQAVVTGLLTELDPDDFADPHLGTLWASARMIVERGEGISKRALLAERTSPAIQYRVDDLSGEPVNASQIVRAFEHVRSIARSRKLLQVAKRIAQAAREVPYPEAYDFAQAQLAGIDQADVQSDVVSLDDVTTEFLEWLDTRPGEVRTIPTPWPTLDEELAGGLHPGRSYVIGGRPGEGKSLVGTNIALDAAMHGYRVLVFSVEMGSVEVAARIYSAGSGAHYGQITRRSLEAHDGERLRAFVAQNRTIPLYLVDRSDITVDYVASRCRTMKRRTGLDVVVVDYLQLLRESDPRQPRERQVAHISRTLKVLARELDCAVIIACQLNRNAAQANRKPALSDLRESGAIEQDADVVILLHHEVIEDMPTGYVNFVIAKNRTGKCVDVPLRWLAYQAKIG
mgnify:CR=1 FL=1